MLHDQHEQSDSLNLKLGHELFFEELVDDEKGTPNSTKNPLTRIYEGIRCQTQEHDQRRWITKTHYDKIQHDAR